jgi:hypothetical protein
MLNLNDDIIIGFHSAMEANCLELLHQGYEVMLAGKDYNVDWEEDTLTAHYIGIMNNLPICRAWQIDIVPQYYIYSDKHVSGEEDAKHAPRIDFRFMKWFQKTKTEYFAEAKNLSEKNWTKGNGASVNASYYYKRYIKTGISHLLSNYYPSNCILIAYIVNGDKDTIISNTNKLISSKHVSFGLINKPKEILYDEYYISENLVEGNAVIVKHLFLQLH